MQHLGVPVIAEGDRKKKRPQRKERNEDTYSVSRWVPVVKDIMEDAISGTLDSKLYPFAPGTASTQSAERGPAGDAEARSARWTWHHKDKGHQKEQATVARTGPRLIIFIAGGVTYSELRCAYEVSSDESSKGWEVVIGSNTTISPEQYLLELRDLEKQTQIS
jgi:syntaxin-binding protein 1